MATRNQRRSRTAEDRIDEPSAHLRHRGRCSVGPARARRRRRRSRRSRSTHFCRTATPAPSWRPTARSTGCACPGSTAPSVFGSLLDRKPGTFRFGPFGINVPTWRAYEPGTNVLVTTWKTPSGWVVVRDALTMGPTNGPDLVTPHTRPPADDDAEHTLVRTAECLDGHVEMELVCEPVFDYGRGAGDVVRSSTRAVTPPTAEGAELSLRLQTDLSLGVEGNRVRARHVLRPGERVYCALSWADGLRRAGRRRRRRAAHLRHGAVLAELVGPGRIPDHRYREPIQRSALAVKGLTYMPTGATVAALTTSLPETPGGERNWDYRYSWMRDSTFTLQALALDEPGLGGRRVHAVRRRPGAERRRRPADHVRHRRAPEPPRVDPRPPERLRRRPSGARRQRRLRPAPERRVRRRAGRDPPAHAGAVSGYHGGCGRSCRRRRRAPPGSGPSPTRASGRRAASRSTTCRPSSMCWVALDRAAKLAEIRGDDGLHDTWLDTAEEIRADILAKGCRAIAACCASTTTPTPSTPPPLLAPLFGFLPGDDDRMRASVDAIADELSENGYVLRYRTDETDDGLSGKEGTFLICSYWLVSALCIIGEQQRARDQLERLLRIASPLGLYAEEYDVDTGYHLGNFPQAFSHLALIEAAGRIILRRAHPGDLMSGRTNTTTSSSSAPARAAARWPTRSPPSGKRILLLERGDFLPREMENWEPGAGVRRRPVHLAGHLVRRRRHAVPAAGPLLRRRRHQALRRRALPAAAAGLRRAQARRRHVAGLAAQLRRLRALVHEGRVALPGARQPRRGPDRGPLVEAVPVAGRVARAADPADRRRAAGRPATTRSRAPCGILLDEADRRRSTCIRCTWCDGYPCLVHAKSDAETIAVRPILDRRT